MKLVYINPNATAGMTERIVATARAALPGIEIVGMTNTDGPAAIEGAADGAAALPGLLSLVRQANALDASAIVIACFDDTGLSDAQAAASCPVIGIGQSSYVMAVLRGLRFSVITSQAVSVPVIDENIVRQGFAASRVSVRAVGLPVLEIDEGGPSTIDAIAMEIEAARRDDGAQCALLGCAGMGPLADAIMARTTIPIIDGIAASARLARAVAADRTR